MKSENAFTICPKCNRRGFIAFKYTKTKVQVPHINNLKSINNALDYNAKLYFRLFEIFLFSHDPPDETNTGTNVLRDYQKFIWFTPHFREHVEEFSDLVYTCYNPNIKSSKQRGTAGMTPSFQLNRAFMDRLQREAASRDIKPRNRYAGYLLFYAISFLALKDVYEEFVFVRHFDRKFGLFGPEKEEVYEDPITLKRVLKAFGFETLPLRYGSDNRNNRVLMEWLRIFFDSLDDNYSRAASRNQTAWKVCEICLRNNHKETYVGIDETCPVCKTKNEFYSKPDKRYIEKMYKELSEISVCYNEHYLTSLKIKSDLTHLVHRTCLNRYLEAFSKHTHKFFKSNSSFLQPHVLYFAHYDQSAGKDKRKKCYLNKELISQLKMSSEEYNGFIAFLDFNVSARHPDRLRVKEPDVILMNLFKLRQLLLEAKLPESFVTQMIERDLKAYRQSLRLQT